MQSSEFRLVAEQVLRRQKRPMRARDIWDEGVRQGLFSDRLAGKTPIQTMKSKLSVDIRRRGAGSIFVRTGPGKFFLRDLLDESLEAYDSHPWQPPPSQEKVVVFPTEVLDGVGRFQGIRQNFTRTFDALFASSVCFAMDRTRAESDNNNKQVLTYIMVRRGKELLAYRRGVYNRTEDMLRGRDCVGFGGHVNHLDANLFSSGTDAGTVVQAAARELVEELQLPIEDAKRVWSGEGLKIIGLLNDDSSSVGRRHFAIIFEYQVLNSPYWDRPLRGEKSITQLRWLSPESGVVQLSGFEYWSQLVMRNFAPEIVRLQPSYVLIRKKPLRAPHLLCLVGRIGSGKTEASKVLTSEYQYSEVNSGRVIARLMGVPPVPETPRPVIQTMAHEFISAPGGCQRLSEGLYEEALRLASDRVLIDGVRQIATLHGLQSLAAPLKVGVVYVYTTPDVAYQLYRRRELPDATIGDFLQVWESPVEEEVPVLLRDADAVLYNWFGRSGYVSVIRELMREVGTVRDADRRMRFGKS
jgi:predicted NUDIX family phosphoesterase